MRNSIHGNYWGIQLGNVYGTQVIGNSIRRNQIRGMSISGSDGVPPTPSRIASNIMKENGLGILISTDANPIVTGNSHCDK